MMEPTSSAKQSRKAHNINTNAHEHPTTSTHVLPIATDGHKSRQEEVLERLLKQQPLYNRSGELTAVEFSPRIRLSANAENANSRQLRRSDDTTLIAGLFSLTEEGKQPRQPLLICIDALTLLSGDIDYLPAQHILFAIDVQPNDIAALLPLLKRHQKQGYRILLNYRYGTNFPAALSSLIKEARLDVGMLNATELGKAAATLRHHGIRSLIAANIRCRETLDLCNRLKFNEFQGSYFDHGPGCATGNPTEINRLRLLELMDLVIARQDLAQLELQIKFDAWLSYQLLAYTNVQEDSNADIGSLTQALNLLKHDGLYRWLTLLLHTSTEPGTHTQNLLKRGLTRAFFLEALAHKSLQRTDPQAMYLLGLISVMDQLSAQPMPLLVSPLRLNTDIRQALMEHKGIGGLMLSLAEAVENGEQSHIEDYAARCLINPIEVNLAMINAMVMAETANL